MIVGEILKRSTRAVCKTVGYAFVGLIHGEKIQVLNVNNGERLETYIIEGERGGGQVIINGPATYKVNKGDIIIINSYAQIEFELAKTFKPSLLIFD